MQILMAPVHLDALVLETELTVIEPMADFSRLPYFDGNRDVNAEAPYLSEAALSQPFENKNLHLPPGIHLHWAMPDALTRGVSDGNKLNFPRLPNRWLVRRSIKDVPDKAWVIESDALSRTIPEDQHPECATTYPYPQDPQQPYRFIGRRIPLDKWLNQFKKQISDTEYLPRERALTVIGYGEPAFAAFYPNCASVFGMYDPDTSQQLPDGLAYDLIGWYSDAPQQAVTELLPIPQGAAPAAQWYQDAKAKLGWDIAQDGINAAAGIPTDLVFFARLTFDKPEAHTAGETQVVFGNTPSQALAAYLASQVDAGNQPRIQEQLEAILVAQVLEKSRIDTGARFAALRHERSFTAAPGGTLWTLKARQEFETQTDEAATPVAEHLPTELAFALDRLNQMQADLDQKNEELESLARQLYSDWARYMICAYPPDGNPAGYPDPDVAGLYVVSSANQYLQRRNDTSQATSLEAAKKQVNDMLAELALFRAGDILDYLKLLNVLLKLTQDQQTGVQLSIPQQLLVSAFASIPEAERTRLSSAQTFSMDDMELLLDVPNEVIKWFSIGGLEELSNVKSMLEGEFSDAVRRRVLYLLQEVPAPRYWSPNEPVALIVGDAARHSDRFDIHHNLPCIPLNPRGNTIAMAFPDIWQQIALAAKKAKGGAAQPGIYTWQEQPWHPFLLEWIVALHPVQGRFAAQTGQPTYDPQFISKTYRLPENGEELQLVPEVKSFDATEKAMRGRSILTRHAETNLTNQLVDYLAQNLEADLLKDLPTTAGARKNFLASHIAELRQQYEQGISGNRSAQENANDPLYSALRAFELLEKSPSLAQSLEGFNQALLMQKQTLQLLPADPIGFSTIRPITDLVRQALPQGQNTAPQPLNDFNPIRPGSLDIQRLRLVDIFGQVVELDVSSALSGESMPGLTHGPSGIIVPPRLVQPARLNFRWLAAQLTQSDGITALEMNSHPATSPICGWLTPNALDSSVSVFDANGNAMGVIKKRASTVQWEMAPGEFFRTVEQIPNRYLSGVVRELIDRSQANSEFFDEFLLCIHAALENIEPEGRNQHDSLALLMAHPLAVVRASLDLQLQGLPANSQDWGVFSREVNAGRGNDNQRETQGFCKVDFPIRLGEYRRLNDGLVGFWREAGAPNPGQAYTLQHGFYVNDSTPADILNPALLKDDDPVDQKIKTFLQTGSGRVNKYQFLASFPDGQAIWDKKISDGVIQPVSFAPGDGGPDLIYYADNPDLMQSIDSPPLLLTMLIDPRGAVHATSGIQPVKTIQAPTGMYAEQLRGIEISDLSTLILTRSGKIELPLAGETGSSWSWLELEDEQWREYLPGESPGLSADFGLLEIREGWLKFERREGE